MKRKKQPRYTLKVSEEVYQALTLEKHPGQTFDGVLREILQIGKERHK